MALVNMKDLLHDAQTGGYAVGSFSIANMEMILGVIKAAEETKSPIILQIAEVRLNHSPLHIIGPTMIAAAKGAKVPVAVHLDHGTTLECIKEALELGFINKDNNLLLLKHQLLSFQRKVAFVRLKRKITKRTITKIKKLLTKSL